MFSGEIQLRSIINYEIDASTIPSQADIQKEALNAFSTYNGDIPGDISDSVHNSFKSWVVKRVYDSAPQISSGDGEGNSDSGAKVITFVALLVAIISTMMAFCLIYRQSRIKKTEKESETPKKKDGQGVITKNRKFSEFARNW